MDSCISPRGASMMEALPTMINTPRVANGGHSTSQGMLTPRSQMAANGSSSTPRRSSSPPSLTNLGFSNSPSLSTSISQVYATPESGRDIISRRNSQPLVVAVAKTESTTSKSIVGTPHAPSTPEGKLLSMILQKERHFFEFAVAEQLDQLASARDGASESKNRKPDSMEALLQRRIAEVKEKECQSAVEDVMYMSIVHKFAELEVPMLPKLSESIINNTLEIWPSKCRELESIHSLEFQDMIRDHVTNILRMRGKYNAVDGATTTKIDKLHIGRIYASSVMYGYFLKSASYRRQLESSIARTPATVQPVCQGFCPSVTTLGYTTDSQVMSLFQEATGPEKLSSYVEGFDTETMQRCAKLKTTEAVNVIEKHTWALFGDEKISEKNIDVTFSSLERLVLEAVAFGSFLWDVESSVNSVYGLEKN
ncbi:hypothetical protein ACHQM5_028018 [Ranunculus cassubicifolius]